MNKIGSKSVHDECTLHNYDIEEIKLCCKKQQHADKYMKHLMSETKLVNSGNFDFQQIYGLHEKYVQVYTFHLLHYVY